MARCNAPIDTRDLSAPSTSNSNRVENNRTGKKRKYDGLVEFNSGLMCTLCNQQHFRRYISAFRHVTGETHREHLNKYLKISPNNPINRPEGLEEIPFENFLLCTICNLRVPLDRIDCHISTIDHLTNGKKDIHRVSTFEFKCQLCNQRLIGYQRVMRHLRNVNHQKRKARKSRSSFELPEGIISDRHHKFWCKICSCSVKATEIDVTDHTSRDTHKRHLREWKRSNCGRRREEPSRSFTSRDETKKRDETRTVIIKTSASLPRAEEHGNSRTSHVPQNDLPEGIELLQNEQFLLCTICCSILPPSDATQHVTRISHRTSGRRVITRVSENRFNCDVCHCILESWKQVLVHSAEEQHREKKYLEMLNGYERPVIPQHPPEEVEQLRNGSECEGDQTGESAMDDILIKEEYDDSDEDFIPLQSLMDDFQVKEEDCSDEERPSHPQSETFSEDEENHEIQASTINGVVESSELEPIQQNATHGLSLPTGISPICDKESLFCLFCDCIFLSDDTDDHVATIKHQEKLEKGIKVSEYEYSCDVCSCRLRNPVNVREHLQGKRHNGNRTSRALLYSEFPSERVEKDNRNIQPSIIDKIMKSSNSEPIQLAASHGINLPLGISPICDVESLFCAYCDCIFLPVETDDHVATTKHQKRLKKGIIEVSEYEYSCDLCSCRLYGPKNVRTHLQGRRHWSNVTSKRSQWKPEKRSNERDFDGTGRPNKRSRI